MIAIDLLTERGIDYTVKGQDALIKCIGGTHEDTNPSLRVDKVTGVMHCFSCHFKGNLFTYFGAPETPLEVRIQKIKNKIEKINAETKGLTLPSERIAWKSGDHRGISQKTLQIWEAFTYSKDPKFQGRIIFPIRDISGKTVATIGRLINDNMVYEQSKYYIHPINARIPLYPAKVKPFMNRVILVEGIFDALNLWEKGLKNTVCCNGTTQTDWVKLSLLKLQGVQGIDIVFDGDDAGRSATERIQGIAERLELSVNRYELEEGMDPGAMNRDMINKMRRTLYGEHSTNRN